MRRLFEKVLGLANDEGFTSFQNTVTNRVYDALGQGYAVGDNEVALVKRLVDTTQGQSHGSMELRAAMLHGPRSYVEFNYLDKPVTKELADMAVIAVVTAKGQRLFQRICIIQNKKNSGNGWGIDLEQLFLLKNFPPFTGQKGIFRGCRDLAFRNASGCLGAFGLLHEPGEMLLVSAPLLPELLRGKQSLSLADISAASELARSHSDGIGSGFPFWAMGLPFHPKEWFFMMEEMLHHHGFPVAAVWGAGGHRFLGNTRFTRDVYDFIRSWTQFSFGQITYVGDNIINKPVDAFANFLIRSAGLRNVIEVPPDRTFGDREFEGNMAVFVAHLEIAGE